MELIKKRPVQLSLNSLCKKLDVSRNRFYYFAKGESQANLDLMKKMDKMMLEHPTTGVQKMVDMLRLDGIHINHKHVRRLMRIMGLRCIYPMKCLSKGGRPKYVYPYLLRNITIERPNQVWSTDISYIPMRHGFMYLYAVIDVYSRFILGWRLSNSLTKDNCIELLEECIAQHGTPEIVNTDQGSQYTSEEWVNTLKSYHVKISMDGRNRCKDNIWIERFWRTIKQEYIYLNPANNGDELRKGIGKFMEYYNYRRPHHSLPELIPIRRYQSAA